MENKNKITVNARGLSCPQPVLAAKKAVETHGGANQIEVLVDTATSRENVSRFAKSSGYSVEVKQTDDGYSVLMTK